MSLACGILAYWPKKKGCTEADDARGDHTTVPLEILNLSFVQLVPKRKYSRRRREGVVSRGGGMEIFTR